MAKLNKDQIKYAVQRANQKLNEKEELQKASITAVPDPRYNARDVYNAIYSSRYERMPFEKFQKEFDTGYYFANGVRELAAYDKEFTAEYDRYLLLLRKIQEDINVQRTAIQDKLYLSDDAAEVLALIDAL